MDIWKQCQLPPGRQCFSRAGAAPSGPALGFSYTRNPQAVEAATKTREKGSRVPTLSFD